MHITASIVQSVCPTCRDPSAWAQALTKVLPSVGIDTPTEVAMFMSQTGHESLDFTALRENLNYSASGLRATFGKYFDAKTAAEYARQPERIANVVYAGRMGNIKPGDGWRFRGGGLLQLTGRDNYTKFAATISATPEYVADHITEPEMAIKSACWFWNVRNLNKYSEDVLKATLAINGGVNGIEDRRTRYNRAVASLKG